jgi:hypothetical protein
VGSSKSKQFRFQGNGAGEAHPAPHAAGKLRRLLGFDSGQAHQPQAFGHPLGHLGSRTAGVAADGEGDVPGHRHGVEQRALLEAHADALTHGQGAAAIGGQVHSGHLHRSLIGVEESDEMLQQDRLAGARAADDHQALAPRHLQVDTVEHRFRAEALGHGRHGDHCVRHQKRIFVKKKSDSRM